MSINTLSITVFVIIILLLIQALWILIVFWDHVLDRWRNNKQNAPSARPEIESNGIPLAMQQFERRSNTFDVFFCEDKDSCWIICKIRKTSRDPKILIQKQNNGTIH